MNNILNNIFSYFTVSSQFSPNTEQIDVKYFRIYNAEIESITYIFTSLHFKFVNRSKIFHYKGHNVFIIGDKIDVIYQLARAGVYSIATIISIKLLESKKDL